MTRRPVRACACQLVLLSSIALVHAAPARVDPLEQVSEPSPFLTCTADGIGSQGGFVQLGAEVEPWVDVNPADPLHIVAAWQQDRWSNGGARGLRVGVSFDGGMSWENVTVPGLTLCSDGPWLRASDPWLSFSPNGDLHFIALVFDRDAFQSNAMLASKSTDGGLTWSDPVVLRRDIRPRFNDKQSITADPTDSNLVYAAWDRVNTAIGGGPALFVRSTDGGTTWEPAKVIHDPGTNGQTIGHQVVVMPGGEVVDFFTEIRSSGRFIDSISLASKTSLDRGMTWSPAIGSAVHFEYEPSSVIEPETGLPLRDGGLLFDVAVDRRNGNLYVVWQEAAPALFGRPVVNLSISRDGGNDWTPPVAIAKTPLNANLFLNQSFLPSVHVNDRGVVAVSYFDFRFNGAEPGSLADYWLAACYSDVADCTNPERWIEEVRLTEISLDILKAPFAGGLFLGDYMGLASAGEEFVAVFSQPHALDRASAFSRRVAFERPEAAEPEGLGWWKHQVRAAAEGRGRAEVSGADLEGSLADIRAVHDIFDGVAGLEGLLATLQPANGGSAVDRARMHLMALVLNIVSGRLTPFTEVRTGLEAGEAAGWIIEIAEDPASTLEELEAAKELAEAINEGPIPLD